MLDQLRLESVSKIPEMLRKPFRYKKIANKVVETHPELTQVKVRVIGGYTTDHFNEWLSIFAVGLGINLDINPSPWGAGYALAPSIDFLSDDSTVILCLNCAADLQIKNQHWAIDEVFSEMLVNWTNLCSSAQRSGKKIIATYFDDEMFRLPSINNTKSSNHIISELNYQLSELSLKYSCLHLVSLKSLSSAASLNSEINWRDWYAFGQFFSREISLVLGHRCANLIASFFGKAKKVLVLDLDNTLWAGVIGDDGANAIGIGDESYEARIHFELQNYAKRLMGRGVLLALASKNDKKIAESAFSHRNMVLKWDDFACKEINWGRKSESIQKIASKLNLGLDSVVFLDDNPAEREEVRSSLPMVMVPEIEDAPLDFLKFLHFSDPFVIDADLTSEDLDRNLSFIQEEQREKILKSSSNYEDFLKDLKTKVTLFKPSLEQIDRIVQLTNKTNQFNLTTLRLNASEISAKLESNNELILASRIEDRFGQYGITSLIYINVLDDIAEIENWVMSCRVFSKTAEYAIMDSVIEHMKERGVLFIEANYIPTKKNAVIAELLPKLGFLRTENNIENLQLLHYKLDLNKSRNIIHFCEVINEL